jgi:ribosomal protein S18 acetylase RimI-like enzyme
VEPPTQGNDLVSITIREATADDIPAIAYVSKKSYEDAFSFSWSDKEALATESRERRSIKYYNNIFSKANILVAVDDDEIIGFIQFGAPHEDFPEASDNDVAVERLYILESHHSRGIGKSLMDAMLQHEFFRGKERMWIDVWEKNEPAIALYKKYGFEKVGQTPFYENGVVVGYNDVLVADLSKST